MAVEDKMGGMSLNENASAAVDPVGDGINGSREL